MAVDRTSAASQGAKRYPIYLLPELYERITTAAKAVGETRSVWMRQAFREKLERDGDAE